MKWFRNWQARVRARGEAKAAEAMREVDNALGIQQPPVPPVPLPQPAPPSAPLVTPSAKRATLDRAAFFNHIRRPIFGRMTEDQVKGCEAILDAMAGEPIAFVAYALATAHHETGGKMMPNVESLNYSVSGLLNTFGRHRISRADAERLGRKPGEPALSVTRQRAIANILYGGTWGRDNLGNTEPDDGWTYRGRGLAHDTGRRNYKLSGDAVGVDLIANPDALLDLNTAVRVMVTGMQTGRYTGHSLVRHLPTISEATAAEFGRARRIINGQDRAADIAATALHFQGALKAAGWR